MRDHRTDDPLWRCYIIQLGLVRTREVSACDAVHRLVDYADRLGRPRGDISGYVRKLQAEGPPVSEPAPWRPPEAA